MKTFIVITLLALTFMACNSSSEHGDAHEHGTDAQQTAQLPQNTMPMKEGAQVGAFSMAPIVSAYLELKNDLTKDDSKAAAEAGKKLFAVLNGIDMNSVPADKHKNYMDIAGNATENAEHIGDNANNIGHQREHFESLSKDMTDLIALFGAPQKLYIDHCPMYNDGKGGDWISETKDIKNPYYGAEMLSCGSMKKEL